MAAGLLVGEVKRLAAGILDDTTWESAREDVTHALLSLPLEALSERVVANPSDMMPCPAGGRRHRQPRAFARHGARTWTGNSG